MVHPVRRLSSLVTSLAVAVRPLTALVLTSLAPSALAMTALAGTAAAQGREPPPFSILEIEPKLTLGLGAGAAPQYEGADEYRAVPFVVARARFGSRYFIGTDGQGFQADVVGSRLVEAGPSVALRFERGPEAKDEVIASLPKVDQAIEVGGFINFNLPFVVTDNPRDAVTIGMAVLRDVTSAHNGFTLKTSLRYRGQVTDRFILQAGPFATFASEAFMNAYYGVDAGASAASGLPRFRPEPGWKDVGVTVNTRFMLTEHWNVNGTVSHSRFLGDAADSPIINQRGSPASWFGGAALAYSF